MTTQNNIYINRELSWLDFNKRVLALSKDKTVPLAEQMKFAAIYGSNLDEFFMVRVGSLYDRTLLKNEITENKTNMTAAQQLAAIMPKTALLQDQCDKYVTKLRDNLAQIGYRKIDFENLDKEDEKFWKKYFQSELFPVLSPQIIDHRHPFPFLRNQEIYLCATLKAKGDANLSFGLIPIGSQFERVLYLKKDDALYYGLVEELIYHYAELVFPILQKKCLFRVTRNADIDVKEGMFDQDLDYRQVMSELLKRLSETGCKVIITTDHGIIRDSKAVKIVGDRNTNTNLRYKLGKNLNFNAKDVFVIKDPRKAHLPAPNLSTAYVFATGNSFFAYPNNYNYYVSYYKNTFQHGGISMEEMLVPLITLTSRKR